MTERSTCPLCNFPVTRYKCTNPDGCLYSGPGWTDEQRQHAWAMQRSQTADRTVGAQYDYTGRD